MAMVPPQEIFGPDIHPENLYTAVGRAITDWETAEFQLAILYSIFCGSPNSIDLMMRYGEEGNTFLTRMSMLKKAKRSHSISNPSQDLEAEFDSIVAEATELSRERHKIAHGVVGEHWRSTDKNLEGWRPAHYSVVPPWHNFTGLTKHDPGPKLFLTMGYDYRTADIEAISDRFRALSRRVWQYAVTLNPPT